MSRHKFCVKSLPKTLKAEYGQIHVDQAGYWHNTRNTLDLHVLENIYTLFASV